MESESKELMNYSPQGLIAQALDQKLPVETLERLMDLSERWQANQAKSAFLKAMNQFQCEVPEIIKTKQGHNNKFAPLSKITKTIQPALEKCGLSYRWKFEDVENQIKCSCIVSHIAGHSEIDSMTAGKDSSGNKSEIHAIGSTRTYLQRYTLIGALGLSTADQDNDGQGEQKPKVEAPKQIDKVLNIISKIHAKTKVEDLHKLDDLIMTVELLDKRKEYLAAYTAQLKKVGYKYDPEIIIK
jgi:hypothetical protein